MRCLATQMLSEKIQYFKRDTVVHFKQINQSKDEANLLLVLQCMLSSLQIVFKVGLLCSLGCLCRQQQFCLCLQLQTKHNNKNGYSLSSDLFVSVVFNIYYNDVPLYWIT